MPAQTQAGDLDRRITILRDVGAATSAYNEHVENFQDLVTLSARRRDVSDGEAYRSAEVGAQLTARFLVRWSTVTESITPLDRIRFRGKVYNITGVKEVADTRNQWREISAVMRADK